MPSKLDDSENLRFLHACLHCSDYSRIDYARVAGRFGIQAPAARMRFARLNAALGGKTKAPRRRRDGGQRDGGKEKREKEGLELGIPREDEDDDENIVVANVKREDGGMIVRVKHEDDGDADGEEEGDVPLMKERWREQQQRLPMFAPQRIFGSPPPPSGLPVYASPPGRPMYQMPQYGDFPYGQQFGQPFMPLGPPQTPAQMRPQTPMQRADTPMRVPTPLRAPMPMQQQSQHQQPPQHQHQPAPMFQPPYYSPPSEIHRLSEGGGEMDEM